MRYGDVLRPGSPGHIAVFSFALSILLLACAASAFAQGRAPVPAPPTATPSGEILHNWRRGMTQVPLPQPGCFTSTYPNTGWHEVPCVKAPDLPFPPARGPQPDTVGGGHDASAQASSHISAAVGLSTASPVSRARAER